jgi:hypothetical protein
MRLGKEQAVGYVEDTEVDSPPVEDVKIDQSERTRLTPAPQPPLHVS